MENEKGLLNAAKLIDWDELTPDRIESEIESALELAKAEIEAICLVEYDEATFKNTFMALENAGQVLTRAWGRVDHMTSVKDSNELREAYNKMLACCRRSVDLCTPPRRQQDFQENDQKS